MDSMESMYSMDSMDSMEPVDSVDSLESMESMESMDSMQAMESTIEAIMQAICIHSVSSPHPQLVLVSFFVALHLSNELLLVVLDALALHVVLHDGELHKA